MATMQASRDTDDDAAAGNNNPSDGGGGKVTKARCKIFEECLNVSNLAPASAFLIGLLARWLLRL